MLSNSKLKNIFSLFVVVYPILNRYAAPIPILTLSEILMMIFLVIAIAESKGKMKIQINFLMFILYLLFQVILSYMRSDSTMADEIGTTLRLAYIYISIMLLSTKYFDFEKGIYYLNKCATVVAGYALLQTIAAFFGVYLTTYIPFLPIMEQLNMDNEILKKASLGLTFRPCSILNEPAALCIYVILALIITLFQENKPKHWVVHSMLLTLSCVISQSSTGIILVVLIWGVYLITQKKVKRSEIYGGMFTIIIGVIAVYASGIWEFFVQRTFGGKISIEGLMTSSRFRDLASAFAVDTTIQEMLLGKGLYELEEYLAGIIRIYYSLGMIGLLLVIFLLYKMYKKGNKLQKKILIFYVILNIGTEIFLGNFAIFYTTFILAKEKKQSTQGTMKNVDV